jgi:hypothetical protein
MLHLPASFTRSEAHQLSMLQAQSHSVTIFVPKPVTNASVGVVCDAGPPIFLTDDAAARLAAMTLGYRVHGSIGILLRAIRRGHRSKDEVITVLRELPVRSTLHV